MLEARSGSNNLAVHGLDTRQLLEQRACRSDAPAHQGRAAALEQYLVNNTRLLFGCPEGDLQLVWAQLNVHPLDYLCDIAYIANMTSHSASLPTLLRAIRSKLALTQEQLGVRLGVSFATVNRWESGSTRPQRAAIEAIETLAIATAVPFDGYADANALVSAIRKRGASKGVRPDENDAQIAESLAILKPAQFEPANLLETNLPSLFSLGEIEVEGEMVAAACPILWGESIFVDGSRSSLETTSRFVESSAIQIFAQAPDRVQIYCFDSSLEASASALEATAGLLNTKSRQERVSIFRTPKDFDEQFSKLTNVARDRRSRLAIDGRNDWTQVFEQDFASTIILFIISNPYELFERPAFDRLPEFLRSAPRLGINTWINSAVTNQIIDRYKKSRAEEWLFRIKQSCHVRFEINGDALMPDPSLTSLQPFATYLELGSISPGSLSFEAERAFLSAIGSKLLIKEQSEKRDFISVDIGKMNGQQFSLGLGPKSEVYHSLLSGATGSGKTVFLKLLLTLICEKYTAKEVQIHLYDFKGGANLNFYRGIPNFINLFECRDQPSRALHAMDMFLDEANRRQNLFNEAQTLGMIGEDLSAYNGWALDQGRDVLPVQLLIIDELGQLYDDFREDKTNSFQLRAEFNRKINRTARQGRSQGMFLLLSSQHFDDMEIDSAIANTQLRMSMRLDKRSQCLKVFESGNTAAYDSLPKVDVNSPRDILINSESGRIHANQIVKLPFVTHESLAPRLASLRTGFLAGSIPDQNRRSLEFDNSDGDNKKVEELGLSAKNDHSAQSIADSIVPKFGDIPEIP